MPATRNDLLFNTYANTVGACLDDCKAAARQVCAADLSTTQILSNGGSFVDQTIAVGACVARYRNVRPISGQAISASDCRSSFDILISATGPSSNKTSTTCDDRLGGVLGINALGRPTGDIVYAYFPTDTPPDGLKSSLSGVPPKGNRIRPNTAFGVDLAPCKGPLSVDINNGTTEGIARRVPCTNTRVGMTSVGGVLCAASAIVCGL